MTIGATIDAAADRPFRAGSTITYEVMKAALGWRWRIATGASGWALSREGAKHKAIGAIRGRRPLAPA